MRHNNLAANAAIWALTAVLMCPQVPNGYDGLKLGVKIGVPDPVSVLIFLGL